MSIIAEAHNTYKRTIKDEPHTAWATWVIAISNSLVAGKWIGGDMFPAFAKEVYELEAANKKINYSDSI